MGMFVKQTLTAGTAAQTSNWYPLNTDASNFKVSFGIENSGGETVGVEHTFSDVFDPAVVALLDRDWETN